MHKSKDIKWLIGLLLMLVAVFPAASQESGSPAAPKGPVEAFATGGTVDGNNVAVLVVDLSNGRTIGEWNADKPLIPASVMKSVTTATLLEKAGRNYRYQTPVYITGRLHDGVLAGNVVVEGSGDPSLNSRFVDGNPDIVREIADALKKQRIDTIRGRIVVDERRFAGPAINPGWGTGDLPHAYGTGTHGFNFEDNATGKASVKDPARVFRTRLTAALKSRGIIVLDGEADGSHRRRLMVHRSVPLEDIMRSCMMRSDNQYAEGMMRTVSERSGHDGSTADGTRLTLEQWRRKGVPTTGVVIQDGSGLSRKNRLTARFLAGVLRNMAHDPYYASFFPLAGQEGTLRGFMKGGRLEGAVAMKTGSMNGIQSYAGYKLDENYAPTHVVVVMVNNLGNRQAARGAIQKMLEGIFQ